MAEFDQAGRQFLAWLKDSGAYISNKIELQDLRSSHAGRGVVAVQDIDEDEILFRIPRSSVLSVENSILSKEIPKATLDHLGPWLSLVLVMLYEYENGGASNWASYFNVLPTEFNTLMFWEEDELAELQTSAVKDKIGKMEADDDFKNKLVPVIKEFAETFFSGDERAKERAEQMGELNNLQLMHKMGTLIMAYAFDLEPAEINKEADEEGYVSEDEDEALPKGMVPLADMLNADADRNNARLFYEDASLSMKALKPVKAGEELFNDYGPLPRSDLLRRYGYITDNYAQYDVVEIPFDLVRRCVNMAESLPHGRLEERLRYISEEHGEVDTGYDITISDPFIVQENISPELTILVQTILLPDAEFERLARKGKLPKPENVTTTDAKCLRLIVQERAKQYPTSLDEDLREPIRVPSTTAYISKDRRIAMAKSVRIGEKKILRTADEALRRLVEKLDITDGTGKRGAAEANGATGKKQRVR